jgi:CIC family chloride channel protein
VEVGILESVWQGVGQPATYALAGMGAFFGAVTKTPVTAIVIVFEITRDFNLVLPLMMAVISAYLVADKLVAGSIYTRLLELRGINLPEENSDAIWSELRAEDVMQSKVETLPSSLTLEQTVQAFARSHHRGFPVLENGLLVGIITQTDLAKANELKLGGDVTIAQVMTRSPITVKPDDSLAHVLYLLSHYKLSRLPVLDHRKLVGIITRSDILRVEADKLRSPSEVGTVPDPSYVVYQTQAPAIGKGRILLPLSNPQTAPHLIRLAVAIAKSYEYELECLRVILVPKRQATAEAVVEMDESIALLKLAEKNGGVPTHQQIRVAHEVAPAILETIQTRHINLLLMGWRGSSALPQFIFSDVADTAIRQASCDVVLVKFPNEYDHDRPICRWLLPLAEGINPNYAPQVLNAIISAEFSQAQPITITLAHVLLNRAEDPQAPDTLIQTLSKNLQTLLSQLDRLRDDSHLISDLSTISVCAKTITAGVLDIAGEGNYDAILICASREEMLHPDIRTIARDTPCPLFLVRTDR